MKQLSTKVKLAAIIVVTLAITAAAYSVQQIGITFKKAVASNKSLRVTEVNACSVTEENSDAPRFSGCNSIL